MINPAINRANRDVIGEKAQHLGLKVGMGQSAGRNVFYFYTLSGMSDDEAFAFLEGYKKGMAT